MAGNDSYSIERMICGNQKGAAIMKKILRRVVMVLAILVVLGVSAIFLENHLGTWHTLKVHSFSTWEKVSDKDIVSQVNAALKEAIKTGKRVDKNQYETPLYGAGTAMIANGFQVISVIPVSGKTKEAGSGVLVTVGFRSWLIDMERYERELEPSLKLMKETAVK